MHFCCKIILDYRVNWLVIEHLNIQGRPDPKVGLRCLWCSNKNLNSSYWHIWRTKNHQKWKRIEELKQTKH